MNKIIKKKKKTAIESKPIENPLYKKLYNKPGTLVLQRILRRFSTNERTNGGLGFV